jgi:hypothetical protein
VSTPGIGAFSETCGDSVNIVAANYSCYTFLNWSGTGVTAGKVTNPNLANTYITMDNNYSVTANFQPITFNLTTSATNGSVTAPGQPGPFTYNCGQNISIVATPANSSCTFVNWTGSTTYIGNVNANSTYIIMNGNYSITANFNYSPSGTPPNAITNLAVVPATQGGIQYNAIRLNWTTPSNMYIDSYIVKYSTAGPVTETNWSTAYNCTANGNVVIFNVSLAPGSLQNCTVTNLSENTTYYFAVKSIGGGQLSAISTPSTTNATALQPNLDVGEWWLWIIRSNTSNTSQNNKFTYKNYCYQIDFVDAVNQSIDYNNTAGFPTINTTNTARIEYNMDTNLSNDSLWGRGRSRVIGAPTVGYAGNLMWDTVGWVKSNDPTVWVRMNALPEVIGAGNMIYGTAAGMSPNFGYYNYSDAAIGGTELRATDGYPFNLTDAAWMQNVFGNAWPVVAALSPQNEAYGGFFKVAGYNASYNVSAVTDQEGNASAYNAAMFMNTSPYSTWYLTANRTYAGP